MDEYYSRKERKSSEGLDPLGWFGLLLFTVAALAALLM